MTEDREVHARTAAAFLLESAIRATEELAMALEAVETGEMAARTRRTRHRIRRFFRATASLCSFPAYTTW